MMDSIILSNIAPFGYRKVGEREYRTLVVEDKDAKIYSLFMMFF